MKKYIIIAASLLLAFACAKQPQGGNPSGPTNEPSISWKANPNFSQLEIEEDMSSEINISAPLGTASFTVTFTTLPVELIGVLNTFISISKNKATSSSPAVLDFISDNGVVAMAKEEGIVNPVGASLSGATAVKFDIGALIDELCDGQILANASKFVLQMDFKDKNGNAVSKSASFNWTSAPEITLSPKVSIISLSSAETSYPYSYSLDVPGKIVSVKISFSGVDDSKPDSGIINLVKGYTKAGAEIDLIEMANVAKIFGLPSSEMKDQTSAGIDLSTMLLQLSSFATDSGSNTEMEIDVVDALGKSADAEVILHVE